MLVSYSTQIMRLLTLLSITLSSILSMNAQSNDITKTIHDFTVTDISGNDFDFSNLKGKKILIVNTASKCGLTPQYKELQELYDLYKDSNLEIVGFPANNFMRQEPGSDEEIAEFCEINYGVTFPMMSKIDVKGKNQHEIYTFLTTKELNGYKDSKVKWNFQKYLIDEEGQLVKIVGPRKSPLTEDIKTWIEG